mgnify:FL=1
MSVMTANLDRPSLNKYKCAQSMQRSAIWCSNRPVRLPLAQCQTGESSSNPWRRRWMLRTRCVPAETPCGLFRPNLALDSLEFLSDVTSEPPRLL